MGSWSARPQLPRPMKSLAAPGTIAQWYRLIWKARTIGYSTTSAKSRNPGARKRYAAVTSLRLRSARDPDLGRTAAALRPRVSVGGLLEEAVNLPCGARQGLLDGLVALERLRE